MKALYAICNLYEYFPDLVLREWQPSILANILEEISTRPELLHDVVGVSVLEGFDELHDIFTLRFVAVSHDSSLIEPLSKVY